ncbi:MAG TPA: hypothetical protein VFB36_00985 [Nevskiaceae bacterium]|nr:hypothetical protein [Nevskiaceae bacterium]
MNFALACAGALSVAAAAVHGIVGDRLVRRIDRHALPKSPIGGPNSTFGLIHVSWHLVTIVFLLAGAALFAISTSGNAALVRGVGIFLAAMYACFGLFAIGYSFARLPSALLKHPAPIGFVVVTALICWGAF